MKRATLSSALLSKAIIVMVFVALSCVSSMYSQAPVISSFTPIAGCAGSSITIVGTNMLGVTSVTIGGTPVASITSDSSSQITAVAASGSSGIISVTTSGGIASSTSTFLGYTLPTIAITPSPATGATGICYAGSGATEFLNWASVADVTSYDVYFGPDSVPYSVTANVVSNTYFTGDLLPNTNYFWQIVPKNLCGVPATSPTTWSFTTGAAPCYSASSSSNSGGEGIVKVVFNTINNTSGLNNYTDYTASVSTTVSNASNYQLSVYVNTNATSTTSNTYYQKAWIDWNQNGIFDVPSEEYTLGTVYNSSNGISNLCPLSITVPPGALTGATRMRVSSKNSLYPASNSTGFTGEVEDYKIIVATPAAPTITSLGTSNGCPGTSITINGTNLFGISSSQVTIGGTPVSAIVSTTGTVLVATVGFGVTGTFPVIVTTSGGTATSASSFTVNAPPSITLSTTSSHYCNPGGAVTLTASGSSISYSWLPAAGLSVTSGNAVSATPAVSTTYTVTGTGSNGCTATSSTQILSVPNPAFSVSPLSSAICSGNVQPLTLTNTIGTMNLFSENFNGSFDNWTKINNSTGGTPANAAWALKPDGYQYVGLSTTTFHSNDNSQFYLSNSNSQGVGFTTINTSTQLISPIINTSGYSFLSLTFHHYLSSVSGTAAKVDITTNGGTTWTTLQTFTSNQGTSTAFSTVTLNLNAYINQNIQIRFFYTASPPFLSSSGWWAIDNVSISSSPNVSFIWSPLSSLYLDAAATAPYSSSSISSLYAKPSATTTYSITCSTSYGCQGSTSSTVTVNNIPVVSASASPSNSVCVGNSVSLTGQGATSYTWSNGVSDGVSFVPASTATYTVTGSSSGCTDTSTITITVNQLPTVPSICEVTVDSISGANQYIDIYWDKTVFASNIDSVIAYRYSPIQASYLRIGAVPNNSSTYSKFTDVARAVGGPHGGDPTYTYYQYKIATHDSTCGNISLLSNYHQSLNFTYTGSQFSWNTYVIQNGAPVSGYVLMKDSLSNGNWQIVTPTVGTTASDPFYSVSPNASYRVDALGFSCSATRTPFNVTHSNVEISSLATNVSLYDFNNDINIYPNPSTGIFTVLCEKYKVQNIKVMNIIDETVYQTIVNSQQTIIDLSNQSKGIYFVQIIDENKNIVNRKIVVE